jgi:tetratricopeptide (TPR) repeat protein
MEKLNVDRALRKAKSHEQKGETDEALNLYHSVLAEYPGNIRAKQGLAKLSELKPGSLAGEKPSDEILHQLIASYNKGQIRTVTRECDRLTKEFPQSFLLWNLLGAALTNQGKLEEAITAYNKALLIKPDYAEGHNNMGVAFKAQGKPDEAITAYNKALLIKPDYAEGHNNMGAALTNQGKLEEAIAAFNKALLIKPDYAEAHYNLGLTLQAQDKFEEAIAAYNKALLIKPDYAEAHRNLSALKKYEYSDPQIVQMEKLYAGTNISDEVRCHLCFALAKSSEDLGNLEAAFRYFKEGNALRKRFLNYDIVQDEELFSRIRKTANSFKNVFFNASGKEDFPTPILILGMPRSGTTLVEQIISNHSKVTAADELKFLKMFGSSLAEGKVEVSGDKLRTIRNQYLNEIKKLSLGRPFVTDKMPNNFFYIGLICSVLPEAKIIHVKRNSAATCWSNYKQYFEAKGLGYSNDLLDVVHYYQMYEELMLFWDEHYPGKIYHLDYEQLTTDQEPETKKLIQYLGIDWEDACLFPEENKRYVKTASKLQVRKKVYKGSSEEWKKFEKYLDRAFDELPN